MTIKKQWSSGTSLQRVLYDPLSYLHPQRMLFPENLIANSAAQAAANELLLCTFQLEVNHIDLDSLTKQWIRYWYYFPQVAYLIGCHSLRADLAWKGGLLNLPIWAYNFTVVTLPTAKSTIQPELSHDFLLKSGFAHIKAWVSRLPKPLAQRFPLLFPSYIDAVARQPAADPLILTLALQHAQRYPNPPPY